MVKKGVIYTRVSTEEQAKEGQSIEAQIKICSKYAKENDIKVIKVFKDEGKSGTNTNRPGLRSLLEFVSSNKEIDIVLVQDTDRLARNTLDHLSIKSLLKKNNCQVVSISQPMLDDSPEGRFIDVVLAGANALQSQITGRKTSKVLEQKAKMGWYPGGLPILGYKNIQNPNPTCSLDRKIIAIDEEVASYIKQVFENYATGEYSVKKLANWLNKKGVQSVTGRKIHASVLTGYLRNSFYIGKFWWNKKLYQGKHPSIISNALFEKVEQVLEGHNQNASRSRKHNFLLRGFVYCADCQKRLFGEYHKKNNKKYGHYACHACRPRTYHPNLKIENKVGKLFEKIRLSPEYTKKLLLTAQDMLKEVRQNSDTEKQRLIKQKNKLELALKEAEDERFVNKTLTPERFAKVCDRYEGQLKDIKDQLEKLHKDYKGKIKQLEELLSLAENIGITYKKASPSLKRKYLGLFFKRFEVKDKKIKKYYYSNLLGPLIKEGSVRVSKTGLRR